MTAKKETPAKRGRKAAPPELRTEPFTIRLTPKVRYGIELLGRSQRGRSLSQVVEWALQRGLNSVSVGQSGTSSLGEVLDDVWPLPSEWQRLKRIYELAPDLLDFIEKAIYENITQSVEYVRLLERISEAHSRAKATAKTRDATQRPSKADELQSRTIAALNFLIEVNWDRLKEEIARRDLNGKPPANASLTELIGKNVRHIHNLTDIEYFLRGEYQWQPQK